MGQDFEMDGRTLWNPSNGAARLFVRQVALFEVELDQDSGIGPCVSDEYQIHKGTFTLFVARMLSWHRATIHPVMLALSEGFVATVLVLAERAEIDIPWERADASGALAPRDLEIQRRSREMPGMPW